MAGDFSDVLNQFRAGPRGTVPVANGEFDDVLTDFRDSLQPTQDITEPVTPSEGVSFAAGMESGLGKVSETVGGIVQQFQIGAETAERDFDRLLGLTPAEKRRSPVQPARNILEDAARISGEFLSPLPQLAGVPGIGQVITNASKVVKPLFQSVKSAPVIGRVFEKVSKAGDAIANGFSRAVSFSSGVPEAKVARRWHEDRKPGSQSI